MTASALMSLGVRAMLANQGAMQTVGHNIANASVEGYSRQQVELNTAQGQFTGAGFFGKGVDIQTVTRSYDAFLTRQALATKSQSAADSTRRDQLSRLESVFKGGEAGIGAATGEFLNAMVDLASHPQDLSARQVVLGNAGDLASRFASAGAELDALQTGVTQDLKNAVTNVNDLARRIAAINDQIASVRGTGQTPNDMLDQRDQLISQLGQYLQVTTIAADDGTLGVFAAGGQRLVLGAQAQQLQITPDTFDNSRMAVSIVESNGARPLDSALIGAGSIGGLLRFQDEDLVDARNLVGQLAMSVAMSVNQQQALGLNLSTPAGTGAPIFGIGSPQVAPASTNARDASGVFTSNVSLTVNDPRQLMASEYSLANDGTGWQLTRLSDGLVRTVTDGSSFDGLTLSLGTPAPPVTDRFLLQPLTRAANSFTRQLDDPRGLAAASQVTASAATTNTGTASVAALTVVSPTVNPQLTATIAFTSDTGDYSWELRDRSTGVLSSSGTGTWSAGTPIALNGFELALAGVPRNGDSFSVDKTAYPASNNGNALALAALRDAVLVGRQPDGSGGLAGGESFTDAWASALADIGVRVQGATSAAEMSAQLATSAKQSLTSASGVNLDEEAARLMQYQQGYQAAAKVLQIAQSLFDTLLNAAA